jgi:transposase InsO family protein
LHLLLVNVVIYDNGSPKTITTDQGREFKNGLNEKLMKSLNIKHHLITPYHPQVYLCGYVNYYTILLFENRPMD